VLRETGTRLFPGVGVNPTDCGRSEHVQPSERTYFLNFCGASCLPGYSAAIFVLSVMGGATQFRKASETSGVGEKLLVSWTSQ